MSRSCGKSTYLATLSESNFTSCNCIPSNFKPNKGSRHQFSHCSIFVWLLVNGCTYRGANQGPIYLESYSRANDQRTDTALSRKGL
jgi:hypothetical protein